MPPAKILFRQNFWLKWALILIKLKWRAVKYKITSASFVRVDNRGLDAD